MFFSSQSILLLTLIFCQMLSFNVQPKSLWCKTPGKETKPKLYQRAQAVEDFGIHNKEKVRRITAFI